MEEQKFANISITNLTKIYIFAKFIYCKRVDNMRQKIILICEECLSRNYSTYKNKDKKERLEVKKHCKRCGKHTLHKESK